MSEKITKGLGSVGTSQSSSSSGLKKTFGALQKEIEQLSMDAAEDALAEAEEYLVLASAAVGAAVITPASLLLTLPLAFDVEVPELALPTIEGSATIPEGDEETQATFNALKEATENQSSMGQAVFDTLDPILQGLEDTTTFIAADLAIIAAGIEDEATRCPIPADNALPTIARMQLFDEIAYAFRRAGMAAGADDPEAPSKIMSAYIALAVEKFVRRAIIRVSLPDDKVVDLASELTTFGTNTAAASGGSLDTALLPASGNSEGEYSLDSADPLLGLKVVPMLTFYGGIDSLKDYGYNFDTEGEYRPDEGETPLVNLQDILMLMKNGINFV